MKLEEFNPNCMEGFGTIDLEANYFGPCHLFIDECGKNSETEYALSKLFEIIDYCYTNPDRVTLSVATNLTLKDFGIVYGEAMSRRLEEICDLAGERE